MGAGNLPNEPGAWDADFSYGYLARLLGALRGAFTPARLGDATEAREDRVFVRHDLDLSLERAVALARLEQQWGVPATYHVMIDSPFYDVRSPRAREAIAEIASLGHEVGLHYDVAARGMKDVDPLARERDVGAAAEQLEAVVGAPVRSVSFHLPVPDLIRGPLRVAGRVSAYAAPLMAWYLSDSRARWREGEPLASVARPRGRTLQLLVHPIWWGVEHVRPDLRLREFLREVGPGLGRTYAELSDQAWDHIIYRAAPEADARR